MTNSDFLTKICRISLFIILCLTISINASAQEKLPETLKQINLQAQGLVKQNKYLEALPLMEKLAPFFKKDAEFLAHYGIAVISNSVVLKTPEARKKERVRGLEILNTAQELGTVNVRALNLLDSFPEDGGDKDNFDDEDSNVANALREGEGFFGRGEYNEAFAAYERAHKLDPKNYEAIVFMGDSLYAQGKFPESEIWFAKAAELEPNRDMAFRYWGDALLNQKRYAAALDKFAEAMIAEPFSKMTWSSFKRWGELSKANVDVIEISPPGNKVVGEITIKNALLKTADGTDKWRLYDEVRLEQIKRNSLTNTRHTLADEAAAWKKVADAARAGIKNGTIKSLDANLTRLVKLADADLIEPYILFLRSQEDFIEDYETYRETNRAKMKKFIINFMFGIVQPTIERNVT